MTAEATMKPAMKTAIPCWITSGKFPGWGVAVPEDAAPTAGDLVLVTSSRGEQWISQLTGHELGLIPGDDPENLDLRLEIWSARRVPQCEIAAALTDKSEEVADAVCAILSSLGISVQNDDIDHKVYNAVSGILGHR